MTTIIDKKEIKCVVFDLDGTLLNTIKTITHYLNCALEGNGLPPVSEAECQSFVGDGARMLITRAITAVGEYSDELYSRVFEHYNAAYDSAPYYLTEAYGGLLEALSALRGQGLHLAVLSNKPHFATSAAVSHFFPDLFDVVLGGRDGVPLKPDPTSLLDTISLLGCTPDECAYVGDSDVDMLTAVRAGVALPIAVTWGFRSREVLYSAGGRAFADTPGELCELIFTKNT